jgi:hypothetical protein
MLMVMEMEMELIQQVVNLYSSTVDAIASSYYFSGWVMG